MRSGINRRDFLKATTQAGLILGFGAGKSMGSLSTTSYDIVIRNGTIVDGLSNKPFQADLGIMGDRIRVIGPLSKAEAGTVLDASGKIVAPGFIDIHAHSDAPELLVNPRGESKIRQGVTTEISGNCGGSSFPLSKDVSEQERRYSERSGLTRDWFDLEGYFSRLKRTGLVFNYATLVGQGSVRELVLGDERRKPNAEELERMKNLVARAMEQGAIGISTGLEYSPERLRLDRRGHRALPYGRRLRRLLRDPYAERGQPGRRSPSGGHPHRGGREASPRDLAFQGLRYDLLVEAPQAVRPRGAGQGEGIGCDRRPLSLHGIQHGTERLLSQLGPRRRERSFRQEAQRPRRKAQNEGRDLREARGDSVGEHPPRRHG